MAIKEIKYGEVEQRAQTIKTYIDEAGAKALAEAGSYTDEQVSVAKAYTDEKIGNIPAPDIPAALPQKYEAFEIQLPQGTNNNLEGEAPAWVEYHKTLWEGSQTLTESDDGASFVSNVVLYWDAPRGYSLLITVDGAEKELKFAGVQSSQGTRWATWSYSENGTVAIQAKSFGRRNGGYWNNTSTVDVYCPSGSAYIGKAMTKVRYGRKQYSYILQNPYVVLQRPTEAEVTRFNTMCQNLFKQKAKVRFTLTEREIEANYVNLSEELIMTSYSEGDSGLTWLNVVSDRAPLKVGSDVTDDMPQCIKGILEIEYTDTDAVKECVYTKIPGESYTMRIGDFAVEEASALDYYFDGAFLFPDNTQLQATFTYRTAAGVEKSINAKTRYGAFDGGEPSWLPIFDLSELFGQSANTVLALFYTNAAVENAAMGGRPVATVTISDTVRTFADANDEIIMSAILALVPISLPQTYVKKNIVLASDGWTADTSLPVDTAARYGIGSANEVKIADGDFAYLLPITAEKAAQWRADYSSGPVGSGTAMTNMPGVKAEDSENAVTFRWGEDFGVHVEVKTDGLYAYGSVRGGVFEKLSADVAKYHQTVTDSDIVVKSEVTIDLNEDNGKIAGQSGLQREVSKSNGSLVLIANKQPTSAIAGVMSIMSTSSEGVAMVRGIISGEATSLTLTASNGDVYVVSVSDEGQIVLTKQQ